jgi:transposase-like protein
MKTTKSSKTPAPTYKEFFDEYPDDDACLTQVFNNRYGNLDTCPHCGKKTKFFKVTDRKCYACEYCGYQLHPLADTIFHKSSASLKNWFFSIYLFSISKNGVAAKELERQLGCTYKTAWRMAQQIKKLFDDSNEPKEKLSGTLEADETYHGGKHEGKRGRGAEGKTPIIGIVQRGDDIRAKVTENTKSSTILPFIQNNVQEGSEIMTDEYRPYDVLAMNNYRHYVVNHGVGEYVNGKAHTNNLEGFWSQLKRSIDGTYHSVSPKYLQRYLDEFSWRYNHRNSLVALFDILIQDYVQKIVRA